MQERREVHVKFKIKMEDKVYLFFPLHRIWEYFFAEEKILLKEYTKSQTPCLENGEGVQIPEGCRAWLETTGDLDDFIFYQTEQKISQR